MTKYSFEQWSIVLNTIMDGKNLWYIRSNLKHILKEPGVTHPDWFKRVLYTPLNRKSSNTIILDCLGLEDTEEDWKTYKKLRSKISSTKQYDKRKNKKGQSWTTIRKAVLIRDNHTCQACSIKTEKVQNIHHINDDGNNKLENLVTMCQPCHSILKSRRRHWTSITHWNRYVKKLLSLGHHITLIIETVHHPKYGINKNYNYEVLPIGHVYSNKGHIEHTTKHYKKYIDKTPEWDLFLGFSNK